MGGRVEPQRSCVGCRRTGPKGALLRIARTPDGVRVDPQQRAPGRGAYVHRDPSCVAAALRRGALARALRSGLAEDELGNLRTDIEGALRIT